MAIINNNVQNVKFLRNQTPFVTRDLARQALEDNKGVAADGTALLARYTVSGEVKTIVGYVAVVGETHHLTIIDVEGAGADVDAKILAAIQALDAEITSSGGTNVQVKVTEVDGKVTAVNITTDNTVNSGDVDTAITEAINELDGSVIAETGYFVKSVTEADGKISGTTEALPTVAAISEAGKPITAVSESLGAISATAGTINAEFVNIADSGQKFTATTVEDALAEIAAEIDGMDLAVVSGDGEVITAVSETDGKVSASKTAIKDVKLTGYVKNTTATGAISATDDIEDALSKLENTIGSNAITNADGSITVTPANGSTTDVKVHIKSGENVIKLDGEGGGIYTNLNLVEITGETLPAEVKVRYELRDSDGAKIGESIDIPKDSHIVSITYNESTQKLVYTYIDVEGETQTTEIDLSHLILETEFASGVTFSNGVAHGVVDSASEKDGQDTPVAFLTVGADGFKISGIKDEITRKINALDSTGGTTTVATGKHVAVEVVETDGKITTVTVVEDNIADADDLTQEISDRQTADTELSNRLGDGVTTANTATAQLTALSGDSNSVSGDTSVEGAKRYADGVLAAAVDGLDAEVTGGTTAGTATSDHVQVIVSEANGKLTAVTVTETNIADADDLAELSGKTITAITSTNGSIAASISNEAGNKTADIQTDADKIQMSGFSAENTTALSGIAESDSIATAFEKTNAVITENERVTAEGLTDLDGRLDVVEDEYISGVSVNGNAVTVANKVAPISIIAATSAATGTTAIVVDTDNSGNITLGIANIDCGYYA